MNKVHIWPEHNQKFAEFRERFDTADSQWHKLLGSPPYRDFPPEGKYRSDIGHAIIFGMEHPNTPVTIVTSYVGFTIIAMDQHEIETTIDMIMVMKR